MVCDINGFSVCVCMCDLKSPLVGEVFETREVSRVLCEERDGGGWLGY